MAEGVKVTSAVQLAPAAMALPTVQLPPQLKSELLLPLMRALPSVSAAVPLLPSVSDWLLLPPSAVDAKLSADWLSVSVPWGVALPVPLSNTVVGLPSALWVTTSEALRVPTAVGVNTTLMTQLLLATTLVPLAQVVPVARL